MSLKLKHAKFLQPFVSDSRDSALSGSAGRPRQCSAEQRRTQLIEKAEEIFLEQGYHPATMDEIARRAGMSKKTIYTVFESKAALFDALLTARLAPFAAPIPEDGRPMKAVLIEFLMGVARVVRMGPVSSPSSMRMIVTPVSASPARMAAAMGEAPRWRGSSEAWTFRQPRAGR